jgi:hypothetical protein
MLDPASRQYVEWSAAERSPLLTMAQRITRPPHDSGKTVNVYYDVTDTKERKQFFGMTARHILIQERYVADQGACQGSYQTSKDGWYIFPVDASLAKAVDSLRASEGKIVMSSSPECRDTVVKHGDLASLGLPVVESSGSMTRETLELSTAPLDRNLFEPPVGFKKVNQLPGTHGWPITESERLRFEWTQLELAVKSWFD